MRGNNAGWGNSHDSKWITNTTTVTNEIVNSYSPGLDKAGGAKDIPYQILNSQMISMFSRLLDKSLHHLLVVHRNINPLGSAAAMFKAIKTHFSCSAWQGWQKRQKNSRNAFQNAFLMKEAAKK